MEADIKPPRLVRENCRFYKGLPVPFTILWLEDEKRPDFRVLDMSHVKLCAAAKLCGICGTKIMGSFVFVCGPEGRPYFYDPPMHDKCARYAMAVCPFLAGRMEAYRMEPSPNSSATIGMAGRARPNRLGLYFTHGYKVHQFQAGNIGMEAEAASHIEWFEINH